MALRAHGLGLGSTLVSILLALCMMSVAPAAGSTRLEAGKSRRLLQTACDPSSATPNTCYNSNGSQFVCCAGSCSDSPGAVASCSGASVPGTSNPSPTSGPTNPPATNAPNIPPQSSGPVNPTPTTSAPSNGLTTYPVGSTVFCYRDFPNTPNTCYNADGSRFACCSAACSNTPGADPTCPPGPPNLTSAPTNTPSTSAPTNPPSTSAPTNTPSTSAPTNPPQTNVPTSAPPTSAPTTAPPTSAPTTAPPTSSPTSAPPTSATSGAPVPTAQVFTTGASVNCFTDFPATPNACYGSDGSKFTCCYGVCSSTPGLTPTCPVPPPSLPPPSVPPLSVPQPSCVETTGTACGNPPPTGFVADQPNPISTGRNPVLPLPDAPFKKPPARPALSGGGQSGTGPASPNTPQSSTAGSTVAGKSVSNNYFYLPTPYATSAGGSVATCTAIGTSNSPAVNSVGVSDDQVFFRTLEHTSACGDGAQWKIRIGTGGQIYYLTSTSNGFNGANLIGPAQVSYAAYTDRVIQSIAYNTYYSNTLCGTNQVPCEWNVHQAGGNGPTYAVLLGNQVAPGGDGVALISWPRPEFQGIDYNGDKRFRSNLFLQTWIRDVGQGSFEITWIWTNVGSIPIDYIDLPWEGLGFCPDLTHYALSVPTSVIAPDQNCPGGCKFYDHANCPDSKNQQCWDYAYPGEGTGDQGLFNCETQTNGWMAFASANCPLARALGVLFAPKSPAEGGPSNFNCEVRFGKYVDPNQVYGNILETIKRPVGIAPGGGTLEFRYYVTPGATLAGVATQAGRLQGFVKESVITYGADSVGLISAQTKVPPAVSFQTLAWYALDKVTAGGIPLLIAQHKATGVTVITSSAYVFSCCTPSGAGAQTCALTACVDPASTTNFLGFIGWGVGTDVANPSPPAGLTNAVLLSSLLPAAQFFDPQHPDTEIQKDIYVVAA